MKPNRNLWNVAVICILVVLGLEAWHPQTKAIASQRTADQVCDSSRSVHVSGAAVVYVTPDRGLLQLGVQSNGGSPDTVRQANAEAMQRVIQAIRSLGVAG